jgi:DNA-directed RNA polymerase subunit N (RpoN/RPB10)
MSDEPRRPGPQPVLCFTCRQPVKVLDRAPIEIGSGPGWNKHVMRVLTECLACGQVCARQRLEAEFDEGHHPKRSLR